MPWIETTPGHFERPFDSLERFYRIIAAGGAGLNREHYAISAVVKFHLDQSISDAESALQHAWKTMRYECPQVAAFAQENTYVYEVPDPTTLTSWLAHTFVVEPSTVTAAELYNTFKPTALATLHYLPHTSEILFHSSHWRIDGIGSLRLLDRFFGALAKPHPVHFGDEGKNLSLSLDEAASVPERTTPEMEQAATEKIMEFVNNVPSLSLPFDSSKSPGGTRRHEIELDPHLTSAIISGCKANDLSVTVATHAAIVCATQSDADAETLGNKYTTWLPFNLRKYCKPPYNGAKYPVTNFHTGIPMSITPSDFIENASQLRNIYSQDLSEEPCNVLSFLAHYHEKVCALFTQPSPPGTRPPSEPSLSSMGLIDQYLANSYGNKIEIKNFWLGVEWLLPQIFIHVWTRSGRMKIGACYNENFYTVEFVQNFLEKVVNMLIKGTTNTKKPENP